MINEVQLFKLDPIQSSSGIYFQHHGRVKFHSDKWQLVVYIDIRNLNSELDLIKRTYEKSKNLCKTAMVNSHEFNCRQIMDLVKIQIPKLSEQEDSLTHLINHKRSKRGLFNAAGSVLNWLIGTPDANDAKYYNDAINAFEEDDKSVKKLLKEQIQIVKGTISNFNETINDLRTHEKIFNENIVHLNEIINKTTGNYMFYENGLRLNSHVNLLIYLVNQLGEQYDLLTNAIMFAKMNIIHPRVISPRNVIDELNKNAKLLSNGISFPLPLEYDYANKLMEISDLKAFYDNNKLIFIIQIPLINGQNFNLYKVIPLPISSNSSYYAFIIPTFPYIALSNNKILYAQMETLDNCKKIFDYDFICSNAITYSTLDKPSCETLLLTTVIKTIPYSCNTKLIKGQLEIWHPLPNNKWIFVLDEPERLTVSCAGEPIVDYTISKTGIVTLEENCKAYSKMNQLIAGSIIKTEFHNILPVINIMDDDCCRERKFNETVMPLLSPIHISNIRLDELNQLNHQINNYDKHLDNLFEQHHIIKYGNWYITAFKAAGISIAIFIAHKLFKCFGIYYILKKFFSSCKPNHEQQGCVVSIYNQCFERRRTEREQPQTSVVFRREIINSPPNSSATSQSERRMKRTVVHKPGFSTDD